MRTLLLLLLVCTLAACRTTAPRHYYALTAHDSATRFARPYPVKLRVRDLEMRRSYRRDELVVRADAHEITFLRKQRWSEPPQRMISGLIRERVRQSGIAVEVQDDSGIGEPDFVLRGEIEAIEQLIAGKDAYAHLALTYRLASFKDDAIVWTFRIDARRLVSGTSLRSTVRALSELLAAETDRALVDLGRFFGDPTAPGAPPAAPVAATRLRDAGVLGPDDSSPLNRLPQLLRDDTEIPVGWGAIFAPSLSNGDREPLAAVHRQGRSFAQGRLGERIAVPPGDYEVRIGSGADDQRSLARVRVVAGKTTIVPATWAALNIAVVDETFVSFRGTYELIRMDSREDFGLGFGADEQLGEVTRVWVLPPGLYKIIRTGGTYRDRTDFATVRLEAGRLTRFTLVLDRVEGRFLGAGEADPDRVAPGGGGDVEEGAWLLRAVVGGDFALRRSERIGEQQGWRVSGRVFLDSAVRYLFDRHLWHTQLEFEQGQTRLPDQDNFQSDTDRLFFHTIYTYELFPRFGPYVRAGLETKLLPRYENFDMPQDVVVLDEDGNPVRTEIGVSRVKLGSTFAPLQLKEGAGGNFRLLRSRFAELDLRVGIGGRQTYANELFVFEEGEDGEPNQLIPVIDSTIEGLEGTLVGLGRITRFVTVSTELDGLLPIDVEDIVVTWRNQVTVRLASFLSLNYRFNLSRDPNLGIGSDIRTEHDVQLRFSFVLL